MAHAHAHGQEGGGNFFLDQLFTIATCGALGLVAVLMYRTGMLDRILVPMFFAPVLIGGLAVLALALIRAVAVWKLAGEKATAADACGHDHGDDCGHDHDHGHAHSHSHAPAHAHSHDHGHSHGDDAHDHGWAPWRYMVLAIPVFLYFLDLPRAGYSIDRASDNLGRASLQASPKRHSLAFLAGSPAMTRVLQKPESDRQTHHLRFKELVVQAALPSQHEVYEGDIGVIRGQFMPLKTDDRQFALYRVDMTCCAADAVFLETRIEAPEPVTTRFPAGDWVQVRGIISFERDPAKKKWVPVITLRSMDDVEEIPPVSNLEGF